MIFKGSLKSTSLIALVIATSLSAHAEETRTWLFASTELNPDPIRVELLVHERLEDGLREFGLFLIQSKLSTQCLENFRCGINYSYLSDRDDYSDGRDSLYRQYNRFEAEFNPGFELIDKVLLNARNRFEYYTDTDLSYVKSRFRHRSLIEFQNAVTEGIGLVTGAETIFNLESEAFEQHRIALLGARFNVGFGRVSVIPWITFTNRDDGWDETFVLWLDLLSDISGD